MAKKQKALNPKAKRAYSVGLPKLLGRESPSCTCLLTARSLDRTLTGKRYKSYIAQRATRTHNSNNKKKRQQAETTLSLTRSGQPDRCRTFRLDFAFIDHPINRTRTNVSRDAAAVIRNRSVGRKHPVRL